MHETSLVLEPYRTGSALKQFQTATVSTKKTLVHCHTFRCEATQCVLTRCATTSHVMGNLPVSVEVLFYDAPSYILFIPIYIHIFLRGFDSIRF